METFYFLPEHLHAGTKAMMFIDGENLVLRYQETLGDEDPQDHVTLEKDVFVWTQCANVLPHTNCEVIRRHYYTSVTGDERKIEKIIDGLKGLGIEQPRVFKKQKNRRSKRVDISLATDMLSHAHRKNYDIAILVTGDEDYVPLVEAVAAEGRRVVLWAFPSGLSKSLEHSVDYCFDIGRFFFKTKKKLARY